MTGNTDTITSNGDICQQSFEYIGTTVQQTDRQPPYGMDNDLVMALKISEQEQKLLQEELKREQDMLEEVLRLSLQEK